MTEFEEAQARAAEFTNGLACLYHIKEMIEQNRTLKENLTAGLRAKDVSIQGLEQQLAEKEAEIFDLIQHIRGLVCRCLWCRLKRRLQK